MNNIQRIYGRLALTKNSLQTDKLIALDYPKVYEMKVLEILRFPRITSIEKLMFICIFDKNESSFVSQECYYVIIQYCCQEGNQFKMLEMPQKLHNGLLAFKENKNMTMRSPLLTLLANTIFTKR
eukprot:UN11195